MLNTWHVIEQLSACSSLQRPGFFIILLIGHLLSSFITFTQMFRWMFMMRLILKFIFPELWFLSLNPKIEYIFDFSSYSDLFHDDRDILMRIL